MKAGLKQGEVGRAAVKSDSFMSPPESETNSHWNGACRKASEVSSKDSKPLLLGTVPSSSKNTENHTGEGQTVRQE